MFTSSFDDRIVHQKSHADVLNSSLDEYNTDKPKDRHQKKENIRWLLMGQAICNGYTYSN